MTLDSTTRRFLDCLHRAGAYGYWWTLEGKQSFWWEVGKETPLPGGRRNIYVGVHPTTQIPPTDRHGEAKPPNEVRSQNAYVAAVNCLFAEYDAKDFDNGKQGAAAKVKSLDPPPSVVIDSGAGYHCYWLLNEPWVLSTEEDRKQAGKIQAAWVLLMDSDQQSKDLARVLRVPHTYNYKYDKPLKVQFVRSGFDTLYSIDELAVLAQPFVERDPEPVTTSTTDGDISAWLMKALAGEIAKVVSSFDGHKHERLLDSSIALGGLVSLGLSEQVIEDALYAAIEGRAVDKRNARKTIRDGIAYGKAKPRKGPEPRLQTNESTGTSRTDWGLPIPLHTFDLPSFPVEVFPDWLREYVVGISTERQAPVDLAAMLALSVISTACARYVAVQARSGWIEPINIYAMTVLPPASGKSPPFAAMVAPIEIYERDLVAAAKHDIARKQNEKDMLEAQLANAKRSAGSAKNSYDSRTSLEQVDELSERLVEFEVPAEPRLIVDDITTETLTTKLYEQKGRIAALSPEGDIFSIMAGRYSEGAPNFGVYLKAHNAETLRVDRGKRSEFVQRPALTMGLTVQPDVIRNFGDKKMFRGQGLLARFFYSIPKSLVGHRDILAPPCPQHVKDTYMSNILHLLRIVPIFAQAHSGNSGDNGERNLYSGNNNNSGYYSDHDKIVVLSLSPTSFSLFASYLQWLEPQLAEGAELSHIADWVSKMRGGVLRIAGLLHMVEYLSTGSHYSHNPQNTQINEVTMAQAIAVVQYLLPHARAAFAEIGADPTVILAKKVLAWIERYGKRTFTKREAYQDVKGTFRRVADLDPILELLTDHNYIRPRAMDDRSGPGRKPSQIYDVNPVVFANRGTQQFQTEVSTITPFDIPRFERLQGAQNGYREIAGYDDRPETDDADLFPEPVPIAVATKAAPVATGPQLDWEWLQVAYHNGDELGIHQHCVMHGSNFETVLENLEMLNRSAS